MFLRCEVHIGVGNIPHPLSWSDTLAQLLALRPNTFLGCNTMFAVNHVSRCFAGLYGQGTNTLDVPVPFAAADVMARDSEDRLQYHYAIIEVLPTSPYSHIQSCYVPWSALVCCTLLEFAGVDLQSSYGLTVCCSLFVACKLPFADFLLIRKAGSSEKLADMRGLFGHAVKVRGGCRRWQPGRSTHTR